MKSKKLFEEQRKQLLGAQFNIDSLAHQSDQAGVLADDMRVIGDSLAASYSIGDVNAEAAEALDREYLRFDQELARLSAAVEGPDGVPAAKSRAGLSALTCPVAGKSPATMRAAVV